MIPDLSPIFQRYENLRAQTDAVFASITDKYPQSVKCRPGCSDCCHALFDLSLVEAMHINRVFNEKFGHGLERSRILARASEIDRDLTRIKRQMFRAEKDGASAGEIMEQAAALRMRCPLLTDEDSCILYGARPITCRLYGIPQEIGGRARVCGLSGFEKGVDYPAVRVDRIQQKLEELSAEISKAVNSRFDLTDIYVPLSMALLTKYDEAWLGIGDARPDD